uniref:Putative secreted protein n=1 Tax=Anopheles marajoara TaxID=58244 RepID=A0A2M4CCB7_9DIPT
MDHNYWRSWRSMVVVAVVTVTADCRVALIYDYHRQPQRRQPPPCPPYPRSPCCRCLDHSRAGQWHRRSVAADDLPTPH